MELSKEDKYLIEVMANTDIDRREFLESFGKALFKLSSVHGVPAEIGMDKLKEKYKFDKDSLIYILHTYQVCDMEHKLKSCIGNKQVAKLQKKNRKNMNAFIKEDILFR